MVSGGDAAEQVVRLSLEGIEVAVKITGEGAKNLAIILAAVLREEQKTKGKARLTNMIKSGKPLKVYSVQNRDLKKFSQEANHYGVLYCVLKDKEDKSDSAVIDIIARAEDAPKIERIMERFKLASVDKESVIGEVEREVEERKAKAKETPEKSVEDVILDEVLPKETGKEESSANPHLAKTEKSPLSEPDLKQINRFEEGSIKAAERPSVREKLNEYKAAEMEKKKESEKAGRDEKMSAFKENKQTAHKQPRKKKKEKAR
ncbi:PcfB family protein [Anaerofustis stercorihominis]|uniref:PcfB family protein n=1 Tax=Anaerofustis stercorihominis TaxID=214853 RepID=UPI0021094062|nr:PcfB family protein [Anaerofustis stercorihominis]MCQ4794152.1 PcfB family protein [Anaerofustis stercorihominis]